MVNINHSEKKKKITCNKVFPKKCGDKEAPVATFREWCFYRWTPLLKSNVSQPLGIQVPFKDNFYKLQSQYFFLLCM